MQVDNSLEGQLNRGEISVHRLVELQVSPCGTSTIACAVLLQESLFF